MKPTVYAPFLGLAALAACNNLYSPGYTPPPPPTFTTFRAEGDTFTIADNLDAFRAALGGPLNAPNTPPAESGRREQLGRRTRRRDQRRHLPGDLLQRQLEAGCPDVHTRYRPSGG